MWNRNCCIRCGQALELVEDAWAEDKGMIWNKEGEYCPTCYQEMVDLHNTP